MLGQRTTRPSRGPSLVAFAVVCALTAPGCGAAPVVPAATPDGATLEVVNLTDQRRSVHLEEAQIGTIEPGARARFRHLPAGGVTVSAEPAWDAVGDALRAELSLRAGAVTEWVLEGGRPEPPPLAELVVDNRWPRNLVVWADGARLGTVLSGDQRTFFTVAAGSRRLRARAEDGEALEITAELLADEPWTWVVQAPRGVVEVVNDSGEAVAITVDGIERGRAASGEVLRIEECPSGDHVLVARALGSGSTRRTILTVDPGRPERWELSAGRAEVLVHNGSDEPVDVRVVGGAGAAQRIEPGATGRLTDLSIGTVVAEALGVESGVPHRQRFAARPGQTLQWRIDAVRHTLRVVNATHRPLALYVGGVERAVVASVGEEVLAFQGRPPWQVTAVSRDAGLVFRRAVEAEEPRTSTWQITTERGALHVTNRRGEAVELFMDARAIGRVGVGEETTFTGVGGGERLIEAVGLRTGAVIRERRSFAGEGVERWQIEDPRATLVVTNLTGQRLLVDGALAQQKMSLDEGERTLFSVRPGRQVVRLQGVASGLVWQRGLELAAGAVVEWRVAPGRGVVEVRNDLSESLAITMDDAPRGRVEPGQRLLLDGVSAGRHALRAEGQDTGRVVTGQRVVEAEGHTVWRVAPRPAYLVVVNESDEALAVRLDGRPYGRVEARSRQGIGQLAPGERRVEAAGLRSGWLHEASILLRDGGSDTLTVPAPRAVLVVDNRSPEAVRARVDDEVIGEVPAGATAARLSAPAGRRRVTLEGVETGHARTWRAELVAAHALHLVVPAASARLVVANRSGAPVVVYVGDRRLAELDADGDVIVDDLAPGPWRLEARDSEGRTTHRERRRVLAGETASWELVAPEPPAP